MVPDGYHDFFVSIASVSGALVGLLFVAVSLAPERIVGPDATAAARATAALAFVAFTDILVLALLALIPGRHLGVGAVVMAAWSLSATLAFTLQIFLRRRAERPGRRWAVLSAATLLLFAGQLIHGIRLISAPSTGSAVEWIAVMSVVLAGVGIARAWELLGAHTLGLLDDFRRWRKAGGS